MKKWTPYIVQAVLFVLLMALGLVLAWYFLSTEKTAPKRDRSDAGILVEVQTFERTMQRIDMEASGETRPSREMLLRSEVSGRVVWTNPQLYPGGRVKKGDLLVKIATKDFDLALANQRINLRQKELALVLERARGQAAEKELEILSKSFERSAMSEEEAALVRREPQLQEVLAGIEAAKNAVALAQLNLERSQIKAPFDAIVESSPISVGDYVSGQSTIAGLIATDAFWIKVSLMPSQLDWLGIPGVNSTEASAADVIYEIGGRSVQRKAKIHSLLGRVDSLGRMIQILLQVDDPLGNPEDQPLLLGTFVRVKLAANKEIEAIALPRSLLREGEKVYICNAENKLEIRELEIAYYGKDTVYITKGLDAGERVISTLMTTPVEGRKLRIRGEQNQQRDPENKNASLDRENR